MAEAITVRPFRDKTDKEFLFSTWLRNYKHSSYFAKRIRPHVFFAGHHAIIDHLLRKPAVKIAVACPRGDSETILGYLAYELKEDAAPVVHFVFVKQAFRKMGVARTLFQSAGIDPGSIRFTHWTYPVDDAIKKWPEIIYDPYAL